MKPLLVISLLFLSILNSYAQKEKILFKVTSKKEYLKGKENPKKLLPVDTKGLLIFKSTEVRYNDGTKWADTVYSIISISSGKNRHEQKWETKDIIFVFDLRKQYVTAYYKDSKRVIIYFGKLYFGYNPSFE